MIYELNPEVERKARVDIIDSVSLNYYTENAVSFYYYTENAGSSGQPSASLPEASSPAPPPLPGVILCFLSQVAHGGGG